MNMFRFTKKLKYCVRFLFIYYHTGSFVGVICASGPDFLKLAISGLNFIMYSTCDSADYRISMMSWQDRVITVSLK